MLEGIIKDFEMQTQKDKSYKYTPTSHERPADLALFLEIEKSYRENCACFGNQQEIDSDHTIDAKENNPVVNDRAEDIESKNTETKPNVKQRNIMITTPERDLARWCETQQTDI